MTLQFLDKTTHSTTLSESFEPNHWKPPLAHSWREGGGAREIFNKQIKREINCSGETN
jgi:hypothetical protein